MTDRMRIQFEDAAYVFEPMPNGMAMWHNEAGGGTVVLMLAPQRGWPTQIQSYYAARVVATLAGRCPICSSDELNVTPLAPRRAAGAFMHEAGCPAADGGPLTQFLESLR